MNVADIDVSRLFDMAARRDALSGEVSQLAQESYQRKITLNGLRREHDDAKSAKQSGHNDRTVERTKTAMQAQQEQIDRIERQSAQLAEQLNPLIELVPRLEAFARQHGVRVSDGRLLAVGEIATGAAVSS